MQNWTIINKTTFNLDDLDVISMLNKAHNVLKFNLLSYKDSKKSLNVIGSNEVAGCMLRWKVVVGRGWKRGLYCTCKEEGGLVNNSPLFAWLHNMINIWEQTCFVCLFVRPVSQRFLYRPVISYNYKPNTWHFSIAVFKGTSTLFLNIEPTILVSISLICFICLSISTNVLTVIKVLN